MKSSIFIISASIVLTLAVGYWLGRREQPSVAAHSESVVASPPASQLGETNDIGIQVALSNIQRRLADLEARQTTQPETTATQQLAPPPDPGSDPAIEEAKEQQDRVQTEIVRRLTSESRDSKWSSATEDQVRKNAALIAEQGHSLTLKKVNCLTTLCQAELAVATPAPQDYATTDFAARAQGMAGYLITAQPTKSADGTYQVVVDFFRQGYSPPGRDEVNGG